MISKWPLQIYAVPFLLGGPITLARNSDCINTSRKSSIYKQTWEEFCSNGALHEKINKFIHCSWNLSDNNLALVTFAHFGNWPWIIAELNPPADNWKLLSYITLLIANFLLNALTVYESAQGKGIFVKTIKLK